METIITLYGGRVVLAGLAAVILDDEAVQSFIIHKDNVEDYAFITATGDLCLGTYEAIEDAGVSYSVEEEAA